MESEGLGKSETLLDTISRLRQRRSLYCAACLVIRDKESRLHTLDPLTQAQLTTEEKLDRQLEETGRVRAVILKARQEGISTYVAARFFHKIHLWSGVVAMVVADSLDRAEKIFSIYQRYHDNLPGELKPALRGRQRGRLLQYRHDSEISVRPSSDTEAGRAQTLHLLHASELAFWGADARDTWNSLMQAVPSRGSEVIVESTAKAAGGLFHDLWTAAEEGEAGWLAIFLPWWIHEEYELEPDETTLGLIRDDPDKFEEVALKDGIPYEGKLHRLSYRKLAWRRQVVVEKFGGDPVKLGKDAVREFQREYPATAEEAFLVSGACFFDEDSLRDMTRDVREPVIRGRLVQDSTGIRIEPNDRGAVRVYERPEPDGHYVVGADTAEGKLSTRSRVGDAATREAGGRDYSSAVALRIDGDVRKVVAEVHGRLAPEAFAEQIRLFGEYYSCGGQGMNRQKALMGVEQSHSSGQTVLRLLREHYRYWPMYWHREINRLTRKIGRRIGWRTDAVSRMPMLDDLGMLVRRMLIDIPSKDVVREMVTFVVWENGKPMAEEGCHDDRVIALAVANQMAREHRHAQTSNVPTYRPADPDSLAW